MKETQKNISVNDGLNIESVLEDSLLRVFVSQQDKYSPVSRKEIELNTFLFPPVKGQVSQPFDRKSHYAVDIAVEKNMPIKAIADGTVVFSEWTSETGYVIILEHNFGLLSVYKHNSSLNKSGELSFIWRSYCNRWKYRRVYNRLSSSFLNCGWTVIQWTQKTFLIFLLNDKNTRG